MPDPVREVDTGDPTAVNQEKQRWRMVMKAAAAENKKQEELAKYDLLTRSDTTSTRPMFDLSGVEVGPVGIPVVPGRKSDAVYMPLMPKH